MTLAERAAAGAASGSPGHSVAGPGRVLPTGADGFGACD
jgi:hypothetical protein